MATSELKNKTAKNLLWGGTGNILTQVMGLVFGIFLARLLTAEDYGIVGLLTIFSQLAGTICESGFTKALVNRPRIEQKDYNAVFIFSTVSSVVFYVILFFCAPLIASFYNDSRLIPLSRYAFLHIVISGIAVAPTAYMVKNLMVKERALHSVLAIIISNGVGVLMAIKGFSYWGIVTQAILFVLVATVLNFYKSGWRPDFSFSFRPIKEMLPYSLRLLLTYIIRIINGNVFVVFLAKLFPLETVGNYNQANKWSFMGYSTITGAMYSVTQPVLASIGPDEKERHRNVFRKMVRFTSFVCFPAMFGLSFVASEFIVILITEKWIESALMLQILSVGYAFFILSYVLSELLAERGRSDLYLMISTISGVLQLLCLFFLHTCGIKTLLFSFVGVQVCTLFLWFFFVHREINYSLKHFVFDTFSYAGVAAISIFGARFLLLLSGISNIYLLFVLKISIVAVFYIGILYFLKAAMLRESWGYVKSIFAKVIRKG
ncbi:MAG: lipopolysaccharide biosynthesis protein [Bacteroides sp.]|nr:lipopolysaccharide biosynthesis protein [Bacteroides sp.]